MLRVVGACTVGAALLIAGCRGKEPDNWPVEADVGYEETLAPLDTTAEWRRPEPVGVVTVQGGVTGGPLTAMGNFRGVDEQTAPGALTITEADNGTALLVSVTRFEPNTELQAVVVRGLCGQPGQVVHSVEPVIDTGAEGIANEETVIPIPIRSLLDGQHSVRLVHPEQAGQAPAMAPGCADLPAVTSGV
jgi:hypothetical protein